MYKFNLYVYTNIYWFDIYETFITHSILIQTLCNPIYILEQLYGKFKGIRNSDYYYKALHKYVLMFEDRNIGVGEGANIRVEI